MNAELVSGPTPRASGFKVDDLLIDIGVRRVTRNGVDLGITGLSFDLLLALVRAAPDLMSTQQLMDGVWSGVIVGAETVTQRIMLLRQSLGDSAGSPRYIVALRGHGYRIAAAVTALAASPRSSPRAPVPPTLIAAAAPVDAANIAALDAGVAEPPARHAPHIRRRVPTPRALGLAFALVLGAGGLWWSLDHRSGVQVADSSEPHPESSAIPLTSLAVMPFANLTGDPTKDYLGDGMAEELINALAQVSKLKVPARTSAFAYKGRNVDIRRIARDLGVATILEGSVRSAGEHLRVSARLVDAASGYQIWSQDYDRQSVDIFKLQDELTAAIVQALRVRLNVDLPAPIRAPPTQDVEAYQLYLQARSAVTGTPQSFLQSIAIYGAALARDPKFARAFSGRSVMHQALASLGYPLPHHLADAEHDARAALSLDPDLAEAHQTLGSVSALRGNWLAAEASLRAAITADPRDGVIRSKHAALMLISTGRLRQAHAEAIEGHRLAPGNGYTTEILALANMLLSREEDAVRFANAALDVGVTPSELVDIYAAVSAHRGRYAEAADYAVKELPPAVIEAGGADVVRLVYSALTDPMKKPAARRALEDLLDKLDMRDISTHFWSDSIAWLAQLGALDSAYALANRGFDYAQRSETIGVWFVLWFPEMRAFRQDAGFQPLVTRLGLMEYWQQYGPPDDCDLKDGKLTCH
ncbi:MAG TPA: winged helix-turn-helix domain-containing protein [Steroidobacteraceae bacterium]